MTESQRNLPQVVSAAEWQAARQQLLVKEKEATRARDALAAELGGEVVVPPRDTPVSRDAVLADPQGAVFSVSKVTVGGP
jgi:predicted enzyme related to lactoylglutathione lyase